MKPTSELAERALDLAREVAEGAYGPNVRAQVESSSDGWHGTIHRHLFEQQMSLWTSFSYLDVISDGAGHIVGFVDHEAYRRADDTSVLSEDDVRAVVADDEFLPPGACIIDRMT